jgi:hypothetical protein
LKTGNGYIISNPLSLVGIQQFLLLWDALGEVQLSQEEDDHVWRHEASGLFSSKSCYNLLFFGSTVLSHGRDYGRPGPLLNVSFSFG